MTIELWGNCHNESKTLSSLFSTNSVLSTCMSNIATYSMKSTKVLNPRRCISIAKPGLEIESDKRRR